jgi:hypothetical protein
MMITRMWRGWTAVENADVLRRRDGDEVAFVTLNVREK